MLSPPGYWGRPHGDRTNLHVEPWKKDPVPYTLPQRTEAIKSQIQTLDMGQQLETVNM